MHMRVPMDKLRVVPVVPDAKVPAKRPYKGTTLTRYGCVSTLTQAGTACEYLDGFNPGVCFMGMNNMNQRYSDRAVKDNIVQIGVHPLGFGLYLFDYKPAFRDRWGHGRQFGVMAQEVETVMPQAVSVHTNGFRMVDYRLLGISLAAH